MQSAIGTSSRRELDRLWRLLIRGTTSEPILPLEVLMLCVESTRSTRPTRSGRRPGDQLEFGTLVRAFA